MSSVFFLAHEVHVSIRGVRDAQTFQARCVYPKSVHSIVLYSSGRIYSKILTTLEGL